jgi:Putative prokaryotic signal transducing protein
VQREHSPEYCTVAVLGRAADAEIVRGLLESDGIPVAVLDAADAALLPGAGSVRVLVPAQDLERARRLLATPEPAWLPDESPPPGPPRAAWSVLTWVILLFGALAALIAVAI